VGAASVHDRRANLQQHWGTGRLADAGLGWCNHEIGLRGSVDLVPGVEGIAFVLEAAFAAAFAVASGAAYAVAFAVESAVASAAAFGVASGAAFGGVGQGVEADVGVVDALPIASEHPSALPGGALDHNTNRSHNRLETCSRNLRKKTLRSQVQIQKDKHLGTDVPLGTSFSASRRKERIPFRCTFLSFR
jgi:hypothetical protein